MVEGPKIEKKYIYSISAFRGCQIPMTNFFVQLPLEVWVKISLSNCLDLIKGKSEF